MGSNVFCCHLTVYGDVWCWFIGIAVWSSNRCCNFPHQPTVDWCTRVIIPHSYINITGWCGTLDDCKEYQLLLILLSMNLLPIPVGIPNHRHPASKYSLNLRRNYVRPWTNRRSVSSYWFPKPQIPASVQCLVWADIDPHTWNPNSLKASVSLSRGPERLPADSALAKITNFEHIKKTSTENGLSSVYNDEMLWPVARRAG